MSRRPPPLLDSRTEEDILRQLKDLASIYTPEWKGWDLSSESEEDLGITLSRVFARYAKIIIDRLNMAPERNLLAFLNLLGASRRPPLPASAPLRFNLVNGRNLPVVIPSGTPVAAEENDAAGKPIVFETHSAITVLPVQIHAVMSINPNTYMYTDHSDIFTEPVEKMGSFEAFKFDKTINCVIYIGCNELLSLGGIETLSIDFEITSKEKKEPDINIERWEQRNGLNWEKLNELNGSKLHDETSTIELEGHGEYSQFELNGITSRWIRVLLSSPRKERSLCAGVQIGEIKCSAKRTVLNQVLTNAFTNSILIDLNREFYPFGAHPKLKDTFYFTAGDSLMVDENSEINLTVDVVNPDNGKSNTKDSSVKPVYKSSNLKLSWEYWNGSAWVEFTKVVDKTNSFKKTGTIKIKLQKEELISRFNVYGYDGFWIRVKINQGHYGEIGKLVPEDSSNHDEKIKPKDLLFKLPTLSPPLVSKITVSTNKAEISIKPDTVLIEEDFSMTTLSNTKTYFKPPDKSRSDPFLCLGLTSINRNAIAGQTLTLYADVEESISQERSKLFWEYLKSDNKWDALGVEDNTSSLGEAGILRLQTCNSFEAVRAYGKELYWIRARLPQDTLESSILPVHIKSLSINTILASNCMFHSKEVLGSSDGNKDQQFRTNFVPVLSDQHLEIQEVTPATTLSIDPKAGNEKDGPWVKWIEVLDFYGSGPFDRHYTLNHEDGTLCFGNGKSGMIPPKGSGNVRMLKYRSGGGASGNLLDVGAIHKLKSAIPYIDSVCNILQSDGGSDCESLQALINRVPREIQHQHRAVTVEDYENLAFLASPSVSRAKCFPLKNLSKPEKYSSTPGVVSLIIVPDAIQEREPEPSQGLIRRVQSFIESKMPPGVKLKTIGPFYKRFDVEATVTIKSLSETASLKHSIVEALKLFLHPLTGGDGGSGWAFGSFPRDSDIYSIIEAIHGVAHVSDLTPSGLGKIASHQLICAGTIKIEIEMETS